MARSGPSSSVRKFIDEETFGPHTTVHEWVVMEREAVADAGGPGPRCLIFMSERAVRRVWKYPANWFELDDAALRALRDAPLRPTPPEAQQPPVPMRPT